MDHWIVIPEQPGIVGERTVVDTSTHPPTVDRAHFVFTRPPVDGLIGAGPLLLVDREAAEALEDNVFGEVSLHSADLDTDPASGLVQVPDYVWCQVHGEAGMLDIGLTDDGRLVTSGQALLVLHTFGGGIENATITEWNA
ncbi:hypothetical protein [Rhodococcus sp. OK302]|uniref:hypothetical protein n=1 Tax=Rhodococcus sp. OK302 TaxID=1882769 RepID=UPI000B94417F|nr:hypothetical protein [Rhodococcus sp. OK302]OYD61210.1 hypothetical protein BDB13_6167 [Rhodococcus sp. OK302]